MGGPVSKQIRDFKSLPSVGEEIKPDGSRTDPDNTDNYTGQSDNDESYSVDDLGRQLDDLVTKAPPGKTEELITSDNLDDDDDTGEELAKQFADVSSALKSFEQNVQTLKNELGNPPALDLVNQLSAISEEIESTYESRRSAPPSLNAARESLLLRREVLQKLESVKAQFKADEVQNESPSQKKEREAIDNALATLQQIDQALLNHSGIPNDENIFAIDQTLRKIETTRQELLAIGKANEYGINIKKLCYLAYQELGLKRQPLQQILDELKSYDSPNSKRKQLDERLLYVDAAIEALTRLNEQISTDDNDKKAAAANKDADKFITLLQTRKETIKTWLNQAELAPVLVAKDNMARRLASGEKDALTTVVLDKKRPESALMMAVLERFLESHPDIASRSAKVLLAEAKGDILNRGRHWETIESEIRLPLREEASATVPSNKRGVAMATVKATTWPAAYLLGNPSLTNANQDSALNDSELQSYVLKDPASGEAVRAHGFNSHSTVEYLHGVNVARTTLDDADGKPLFSGTRHATLSAYDLYPDTLRGKTDAFLNQMQADLCRKIDEVTHLFTDNARASTAAKPQFKTTELDDLWAKQTGSLAPADFIAKACKDESFCQLLRRRAALNRAREVFLTEVLGNPALLERVRNGEAIPFTSISLITPDPFRHFLAKLFPWKFRKNDEYTMRKEELQAWKDLQESISKGQIYIDNQPVNATVMSLCVGVNQMAQTKDWGSLGRWLLSGWRQSEPTNREALANLIGNPDAEAAGGVLNEHLQRMEAQSKKLQIERQQLDTRKSDSAEEETKRLNRLRDIEATIRDIDRHNAELLALRSQIHELWTSGQYRRAGSQPYKFAARLARISTLIGGGVAFNCKSGKDRTGHLDIEAKLMAVQSAYRSLQPDTVTNDDGTTSPRPLVPPYGKRGPLELRQIQAFIFQDQTRTVMQRYNTGVEGSKLSWWQQLYQSFIGEEDDGDFIGREFRGRSAFVAS